jgi:hypothetical protein
MHFLGIGPVDQTAAFVVMGRLDRSIVLPKLALTRVFPPMVGSSQTMT